MDACASPQGGETSARNTNQNDSGARTSDCITRLTPTKPVIKALTTIDITVDVTIPTTPTSTRPRRRRCGAMDENFRETRNQTYLHRDSAHGGKLLKSNHEESMCNVRIKICCTRPNRPAPCQIEAYPRDEAGPAREARAGAIRARCVPDAGQMCARCLPHSQ